MTTADTPTLDELKNKTTALCNTDYFRDVILRHCPGLPNSTAGNDAPLVTEIHPADQMLNHSLQHHLDANAALSQYYNVGLQQFSAAQQILELLYPEGRDKLTMLDFACGYGRLLRFMSQYLPRHNLYAAEIQAGALAYVKETFKVSTIASHGAAEDFQPPMQYDVIWVASLFSHLPKTLFRDWLARLHQSLSPEGVLCFSVHDACLVPEGHEFPTDEGYLFWPQSENADLDTSLYGTTYVNETFVRNMIESVCGAGQTYYRIPRALAHEQDIYVVAGGVGCDLSALKNFRRGPWGWVDERTLSAGGELYLRGWAASVDDGPLEHIHITVNGQQVACPSGKTREDVARVFADSRLASSGWEFRYQLPKNVTRARVEVSASTERNEHALLYTGDLYRPTPESHTPNAAPGSLLSRLWQRLRSH
ncbi:class I SAM-dependent methyltransferase [Gilvimarinus agarilyticus]|uniref:class I SAM-dependent methyltransferase n=1 Tax=Gilvimarinus agarilyticus TaxID=679259 RepID=UPI000698538F|nr:class I SAM-dependent methyltransferase [Gilvimarinus agarilyticus]